MIYRLIKCQPGDNWGSYETVHAEARLTGGMGAEGGVTLGGSDAMMWSERFPEGTREEEIPGKVESACPCLTLILHKEYTALCSS